jgi:hypothetical protein
MSCGRSPAARRDPPSAHAEIPSFDDLLTDPELAPLAMLEAAGLVLIQALVAANPEMLQVDDCPRTALEPVTVAAHRVVAACRALHEALDLYRARVRECRNRNDNDEIPF